MKRPWFLILFFLSGASCLIAMGLDQRTFEIFVKPLIVLSLIGQYVANTAVRSPVFILALFFCWVGDVLLLFQAEAEYFFLLGLLSFLIAHVFYILSYRKHQWKDSAGEITGTQKVRLTFPVVLAGTGLVVILFPYLGEMKIPVMMYALVLTLMVLTAIYRLGRTSLKSFWMVFSGAVLFMTSDSFIAINKFLNPISKASFWIVVTYCTAQFLIVQGILLHKRQT